MKKIFLVIFTTIFLNANNITVIQPNNYYTKANLNEAYIKILAYEETDELIKVINAFLNNSDFKQRIYFEEMGKVKVSTFSLLQQLKYFLAGWPKYTNTYFDNNSNLAGIEKILKEKIENDSNFLDIPQKVINEMRSSIKNLQFFEIAKKIQYDLKHKNLKNSKEILKNFNMLFSSYVNTVSKIKSPLLKAYNKNIEDKLTKEYRIYTKTSLIKIMEIFKKLLNENYEAIKNGL